MSRAGGWLAVPAALALHAAALAFVRLPAPQDPVLYRAVPVTGPRLTFWPTAPRFVPADVTVPPSPPAERRIEIQRRREIHPAPPRPPQPPVMREAPLPPLWRGEWELAPPLPPLLAALAAAEQAPRATIDGVALGLPASADDEAAMLVDPPAVLAGLSDAPPETGEWRWLPANVSLSPGVAAWLAESGSQVWRGERDGESVLYLPLAARAGWEARRPESLALWQSLVRSAR